MTKTKKTEIVLQTLKGFRDFLPEEMVIRQKVIDILRGVFESYGYEPLETPSLEYAETLLGKYGDEADKLIYLFKDRGGREVGLRYDLTVPLARVIASNPNLPMPFKRYQIQPVWRADKPQAGRFREFLQCDADIVGAGSKYPLADAEVIILAGKSLEKLGFKNFKILINDRWILYNILSRFNIPKKKRLSVIRTIDKWEKIQKIGVRKELSKKGFSEQQVDNILEAIQNAQPTRGLNLILKYIKSFGLSKKQIVFTPTLARGLDYYTGMIFEVLIDNYTKGSVAGGGRYDTMVGFLADKYLPAVGFSFGIDRLIEAISQQGLLKGLPKTTIQVLVTIFSPEYVEKSIEVATTLRFSNVVNTELYPDPNVKLDKQLKYADKKGVPYVIILGPEEVEKNLVTIKNMKSGEQKRVGLEEAGKIIKLFK